MTGTASSQSGFARKVEIRRLFDKILGISPTVCCQVKVSLTRSLISLSETTTRAHRRRAVVSRVRRRTAEAVRRISVSFASKFARDL